MFSTNLSASLAGPAPPASVKLPEGLSGNIALGINLFSGNYRVKTMTFKLLANFNIPQNLLIFRSDINYGTISYDGKHYIENTNNYSFEFKHLLFFHSGGKSYTFYDLQDQSDRFRGYWNIFGIESGLGYNLFELKDLTVRGEIGMDYSQIRYTLTPEENVVSGMLFFHLSWKPLENISFLFESKYLSNLKHPHLQDYRLESLLSSMIAITSKIGLKIDFNIVYINLPPLITPVDSEGKPIPGREPVPGKRISYSLIQSIMVKF